MGHTNNLNFLRNRGITSLRSHVRVFRQSAKLSIPGPFPDGQIGLSHAGKGIKAEKNLGRSNKNLGVPDPAKVPRSQIAGI